MSRRRTPQSGNTIGNTAPQVGVDTEYVNALKTWGDVNYIKGLKSDFDFLKNATSKIDISSDKVVIQNVSFESGAISCANGSINNVKTDRVENLRASELAINQLQTDRTMSNLKLSSITPLDSSGVNIAGVSILNNNINLSSITSDNDIPVDINGVLIKDKNVSTKTINGLANLGVNIDGVHIQNNTILAHTIKGTLLDGLHVGNAHFQNDIMTTKTIKTDSIIEKTNNQGVNIAGLNIVNGTINGVNFDTFGRIQIDNLQTSTLSAIDKDIRISGNVQFENASISSGETDGFQIDGVTFKNGNIYVNDIFESSELESDITTKTGITIGGVKLSKSEVTASNMISNLIQTNTIITDNIIGGTNGVNLNGITCKNNKLMLPSVSGDTSVITMYNQSGQIILESPDGNTYTPPTVSHWMDWDVYNNDPHIDIQSNATRFTIIDQSIWVNINLNIIVHENVPINYTRIWISLPENYKSTRNKFQTFCIRESHTGNTVMGNIYINGITNNDVVYFEFQNDTFIPEYTYSIFANMVYEYTNNIPTQRLTPWQTWFPIRKDNQIKTIAVNNTRYYKIGSNVWLSIDIDITTNTNYSNYKNHAYVSLPPKTNAKNIYFTNPALIESDDNIIGTLSTGITSSDVKLGTNILRISNPDGFEPNKTYTIKGQIIFEEANTSAINFFFDQLDYNFGVLDNTENYGFMGDDILIEFIHNVDTDTISNIEWLSYLMEDSFDIHIANNDGFSTYTQMAIVPFRNTSRVDTPWRVVKQDTTLKLQFTVDGKTYVDQFIISYDDEDPY